ncbi:MAG TPA: hypothetical protein VGD99_14635 [Anaerolineae bacterium]|jgi:hypothetical protein
MMAGLTDLNVPRQALRELIRIVKETRQVLGAMLVEAEVRPRAHRLGRLAQTLEHLGDVREGFLLSQRTSPHASLSELRALVQHILLDWNWLDDFNLTLTPGGQIELPDQQLVFYNHALVALAVLPRLPADAVTFPQRRPTYGDVRVPALPGEKLARIEELEVVIYQANVRPVSTLTYDAFRRTYAFFEASTWLVSRYLEPLLGD